MQVEQDAERCRQLAASAEERGGTLERDIQGEAKAARQTIESLRRRAEAAEDQVGWGVGGGGGYSGCSLVEVDAVVVGWREQ